jgi:hypothetical protein
MKKKAYIVIMTIPQQREFVRKKIDEIYPQLIINCKKTCGTGYQRWGSDLLAVAITFFLEKPLTTQLKTIENNKLENFITFIMGIQLKSSTSHFYCKYRKPLIDSREIFDNLKYKNIKEENSNPLSANNPELMDCMYRELDNYENQEIAKMIRQFYFEDVTITQITKEAGIGLQTFKKRVQEAFLHIQKKCNTCVEWN